MSAWIYACAGGRWGTYDDEIEPRAVELARLALELDADRSHLLRLPRKRVCKRVIAIDRLLADVDADDTLDALVKVLRDQTYVTPRRAK